MVPRIREPASEEDGIAGILEQLDVAWNAHDAGAFAAQFSVDADFTNVRGMQASGRDGVRRFMAPLFATMFRESEQRILRSPSRFLTSTLATVDVWWTMEGARTLDGLPRPTRYGLFDLGMRRERAGRRILVWHNMELSGPPPQDPNGWRFIVFDDRGPMGGSTGAAPTGRW
jgi:uncharacterized protein (TIGR02246 family)